MKVSKFIFFNLLPILVIMATIYIASSQTSDQQDISPVLDRVTDENSLRGMAATIVQILDLVTERAIAFAISNPHLVLIIVGFLSIIIALTFFRLFRSSDSLAKKTVKSFVYTSMILAFVATFVFVLKSDAFIQILRNQVSLDQIRNLLQTVDFTYADYRISLETHGVDGLLEFLLRKAAHFILFGLLGFFLFLALHRLRRKSLSSFIITIIIVISYAALDEYRQTFIPSRSGLVEDVILDTAGGVFGATIGWLKRLFSRWLQ